MVPLGRGMMLVVVVTTGVVVVMVVIVGLGERADRVLVVRLDRQVPARVEPRDGAQEREDDPRAPQHPCVTHVVHGRRLYSGWT